MKKNITALSLAFLMLFSLLSGVMPTAQATTGYVEVVSCKYDEVRPFSDGMAAVRLNGKWGFIDKTGKEVIPCKYYIVTDFYTGVAVVRVTELLNSYSINHYLIDKAGKETELQLESLEVIGEINGFREDLAVVKISNVFNINGEVVFKGYWGYMDTTGKIVIKKYDNAKSFSNGMAAVVLNGKWGFVDKNGNEAVPCKYDSAESFSDGVAVVEFNGKSSVIDKTGTEVVTLNRYDKVFPFSDGIALVLLSPNSSGGWDECGIINKAGKEIVPPGKYVSIGDFYEGYAVVCTYDANRPGTAYKYGFIDKTGKEIEIRSSFSVYSMGRFSEGLASIEVYDYNMLSMKYNYIDETGNVVIDIGKSYDYSECFFDGMAAVCVGEWWDTGKWGFIDKTGAEIVPCIYDMIGFRSSSDGSLWRGFSEGMAAVQLDSKWGFIAISDPLSTASSWARDGITNAVEKGFVPADLQSNYASVITRAEFCRMAVKWLEYKTGMNIDAILNGKGLSRNPNAFTDTNDPDILAAYALGITNGTGNNQFTPSGQFNREQAATMIRNTCKAAGMDISSIASVGFVDINTASSWAVDAINYVRNAGIMQGTGNNDFSPKATYTREQSIITFNAIK